MKSMPGKLSILLFLVIALATTQCKKNKLLPETQVGNNTFGCILNGEIFKPQGGGMSPNYQCYYQQLYPSSNGYVFNVSGSMKGENCEIKSIKIIADSLKLSVGTYPIGKTTRGKFAGGFDYYKNCVTDVSQYVSSAIDTRSIEIKKFDEINNIVSGTFWFNATNAVGQKVQVRDGRFDTRFSR